MAETERIASPTLEQFAEAAEVNYERTPFQRSLDSPARFRAFQALGVELAVLRRAGRMEAVTYMLPSSFEKTSWMYMFQLAARDSTPAAGALLVQQVMLWYPAILGIGITPGALRIYQAFKWTHLGDLWRAVHPLRLNRLLDDHGYRLEEPWQSRALGSSAGIYNLFAGSAERLLAAGRPCEPWAPDAQDGKAAQVAAYLPLYRAGELFAANVGGAGRIGNAPARVPQSRRDHAALWHQMRRDGLAFCEMLVPSEELRRQAVRLGYWPLPLPVWYWDPHHTMGPVLDRLQRGEISFFDTDKVV